MQMAASGAHCLSDFISQLVQSCRTLIGFSKLIYEFNVRSTNFPFPINWPGGPRSWT